MGKPWIVSMGVLVLSMGSIVHANLHKAPPSVAIKNSKKAVFVDFKAAHYQIIYDIKNKKAQSKATIKFHQKEDGHAIFDLVPKVEKLSIDGQASSSSKHQINRVTTFRYIDKATAQGEHELVIENQIVKNVQFNKGVVRNGFWMTDLADRGYLERYLPSNLEFDQFEATFSIKILNAESGHQIMANGVLSPIGAHQFEIKYPGHYTASSFFFHLFPQESFAIESFDLVSMDKRVIPVTIYGNYQLKRFTRKTIEVFKELEQTYGPWPHPQLIIYATGFGGMEYAGATMTGFSALGHELIHSYFARGVMPARGNAGWFDEAVASWRDDGYPQITENRLSETSMGSHSVYRRTTDTRAYRQGMQFIGYLDLLFKDQGGMKSYLKSLRERRLFSPLLARDIQADIEWYFNRDLSQEFNRYIYASGVHEEPRGNLPHPYHPLLTERQERDLL